MTTLVKAIAFVASLGIALLANQAIAASYSPKAPNIPKSVVTNLVEEFCSFPNPNPKTATKLEFACFEQLPTTKDARADYYIKLIPLFARDFNQDGYRDWVIDVTSEGPLGGSVHSHSTIQYLLLGRNQQIKDSFEVLLYAPFSEEIIEYELSAKGLEFRAIPNFRSHPEAFEDGELLVPERQFRIEWQNDDFVEVMD